MRFRVSHIQKIKKSRFPRFRVTVPANLREQVGQKEIKESLRSTDPIEAEVEATKLRKEWKERFSALQAAQQDEELQRAPALVDRYLRKLEADTYGDLDGSIYGMQKVIALRILTAWGPDEYYARGANRALAFDPDQSTWAGWDTDPDPLEDLIPEESRNDLIERIARVNRNAETLGFGFREILQYILEKKCWDTVRFEILMIEHYTRQPIPFDRPIYAAVAEHLLRRLLDYQSYRWNMDLIAALKLPIAPSATPSVPTPVPLLQTGSFTPTPADWSNAGARSKPDQTLTPRINDGKS